MQEIRNVFKLVWAFKPKGVPGSAPFLYQVSIKMTDDSPQVTDSPQDPSGLGGTIYTSK
jgi:hypothetical protein